MLTGLTLYGQKVSYIKERNELQLSRSLLYRSHRYSAILGGVGHLLPAVRLCRRPCTSYRLRHRRSVYTVAVSTCIGYEYDH